MFLKNKNIIFKIRRSKVTDYAALNTVVFDSLYMYVCPFTITKPIANVTVGLKIWLFTKDFKRHFMPYKRTYRSFICYSDQIVLNFDSYKHSVSFVRHRQTVRTQIRRCKIAAAEQGLHRMLTECSIS